MRALPRLVAAAVVLLLGCNDAPPTGPTPIPDPPVVVVPPQQPPVVEPPTEEPPTTLPVEADFKDQFWRELLLYRVGRFAEYCGWPFGEGC